MKSLDTLIPDIAHLLQLLNHGQALDIPEEELDRTMQDIKECIQHWSTPQSHTGLRMSNIGRNDRYLYLRSKNDPVPSQDPWIQMRFLLGHVLEQIILMFARVSGHEVTDTQTEVDVEGIKGHLDSRIDGEVVDVKTASPYAFKKFLYGSLHEDDPFGYLGQLSGYEEAFQTNAGGFLAMDKVSGRMALHRPEQEHKIDATQRIRHLKEVLEGNELPEQCYPEEPMGNSGNMKIASGCKFCEFKHICFQDANDGAGLRSFRYAKGLEHLTKVVQEPRVEEVL